MLNVQISRYLYRIVLCAQHEFAAFCMKYPGESRYQMACQGSELIVGLGKMYCEECGTGKNDMAEKLGNFYDITGTSMVYYNKVDFKKILKKLKQEQLLIFNEKKTPLDEDECEKLFPPLMKILVKLLDKFEVGDVTPHLIEKILSQLEFHSKSLVDDNIQQLLLKSLIISRESNVDIFNKSSDEYKDCIEQIQQLKQADQ